LSDFRSEITILAWPVTRRDHIPSAARAELRSEGVGLDGEPGGSGASACLRRRSDGRGRVLVFKDPEAKGGLERYRQLIEALVEGGLQVYGVDGGCEDYDAEWEYHAPGEPRIARTCNSAAETTISVGELFDACRQADTTLAESATVADVAPTELGAAARRLFAEPPVPKLR
jgi:hypothetical protein